MLKKGKVIIFAIDHEAREEQSRVQKTGFSYNALCLNLHVACDH